MALALHSTGVNPNGGIVKALLHSFKIGMPRAPWHVWFTAVSLGLLMASVNAYSDTYNFYFDKKKKGQEAEESESQKEEVVEKKEEEQKQVVNVPSGQTPIVIHNNNHVGNVTADQTAPVVTPPAPIVTPPPVEGPTLSSGTNLADSLERPSARSPWKISLSAMVVAEEMDRAYSSQGVLTSYNSMEPTVGGLVTLGYSFSRSVGVNLYGGLRVAESAQSDFHAGVDLEVLPFRIPISKDVDLFELGFLFGGSTAMAAYDNIGSLHIGVRTNINVASSFGLTAAARANLGYVMVEAGISARI